MQQSHNYLSSVLLCSGITGSGDDKFLCHKSSSRVTAILE